jgi:DNA-directed RNA polymerase specialized sigma24 family protein
MNAGEGNDELTLGDILREAIDRWRSGERPTAAEYAQKYPHLREEIEADFRTIEILEASTPGAPGGAPAQATGGGLAVAGSGTAIAELLAEQPPLVQRLIFLRNFRKLRWEEITRFLGRPEAELRRSYARALREIIDRCSAETVEG